jgi:hypothetical protein
MGHDSAIGFRASELASIEIEFRDRGEITYFLQSYLHQCLKEECLRIM